jgi:hypothetical protein
VNRLTGEVLVASQRARLCRTYVVSSSNNYGTETRLMRKDQRQFVLSLALAGTVLAGAVAPVVATELSTTVAGAAFLKWSPAFLKIAPSAPVAGAAFHKS